MIDEQAFRARYTEDFVRDLAAQDNPVLRRIKRNEGWTGASLFVRRPVGEHAIVERERDYEVVEFAASLNEARVFDLCDQAIKALGARIEGCLNGRNSSRKGLYVPVTPGGGVRPIASWEGDDVALWSLGSVPRWLQNDALAFLRVRGEGKVVLTGEAAAAMPELLKQAEAKYGDALFVGDDDAYRVELRADPIYAVRFGFYGNTAPEARVTGYV